MILLRWPSCVMQGVRCKRRRRCNAAVCRLPVLLLVTVSCLIIYCVRHVLQPLQFSLSSPSGSRVRKHVLTNFTPFEVLVSASDRNRMISLLDVLTSTLEAAHVNHFMIFGTLLGSYRHHGFIPWDDDMDLMMSAQDKPRVLEILSALKPDYSIRTCLNCRLAERFCNALRCNWRFMRQSDRTAGWPFVDLFFYKENATHFWNDWIWAENEFWSKTSVFPLRRRPFGGLMVFAPCDAAAALSAANINVSNCVSSRTDHRRRVQFDPSRTLSVACTTLYDLHPFVVRSRSSVGPGSTDDRQITETLVHNNSRLQEIALNIGC